MEDPKPPSPPPPPTTTRAAAKKAALANFRSLVVQFVMASAPNMLPQNDQIEQRIQELVPSCPTPRHPTYVWMIEDAITQLNEERGSNMESISEFILSKHKDLLPLAHATLLKHHMKKLCEIGSLVLNDDGLYFFGEETNEPEPKSMPATDPDPDSDPDPSLDYIYESDSTSSSGESFNPIVEIEMIKKDKTVGKRVRGKRKNVHCRTRSRKKDLLVGIELEQESEADEERTNESHRIVSEKSISRVTGKQGQKRKRGRPRKNITMSSDQTFNTYERKVHKNVNIAVAEGTLLEQDEVVADNQNQQNEDRELRPQNEVYIVDSDDTANIAIVEQSDEDIEDLDLLIDQVCAELQAVNETQSFTLEDEIIRPRTKEQHRVHLNKDLVNDRCQVEPSTMVTDVPVEQKCELNMERAESLQKDALMEETGRSMNITEENGIHNLNEVTEVENKNQNETVDFVNSNCQAEPNSTMAMDIALEEQECQVSRERTELLQNDEHIAETRMNAPEARECGEEHTVNGKNLDNQACLMDDAEFQERESDGIEVENHLKNACENFEERDEQAITNQPEVYECEVGMERTESLQKDVHLEETAKSMNKTEANGVQDLIEELEFENENHNEPNETIDLANGDSRAEPSTMVISVALEEKEHQVSMEKTECLPKDTRKEETEMNVTATKECGQERDTNEQSMGDQTCLTNDVERHERDSDVIEENNHLRDACEIFDEQGEQAITEQNHPDEHECEVIMERTESSQNYAHIEETGKDTNETETIGVGDLGNEELKFKENQNEPTEVNECVEEMERYVNEQSAEDQACEVDDACLSQRFQEDGVNKSKSQQSQEIEMPEEYENLDRVRQSLEEENIYGSKEQEKNEDVNQQLNELKQDAGNTGEDKGVAERMMGLEILVEFDERSCKSMLECEQNSVSEKMELESNCSGRTNALEQLPDTSSVKKSPMVKAVNVVQQVEKRKLRSRSNKAQPIESEVKGSIIVPSLDKFLETDQRKKLRVTKQLELESNCSGRTNALEQRPETSSVKKSPKVKAVNVVQQVEKRQLRSRSNKAHPIESEVKGSIIVPSLDKSSETDQRKKLRVTKQLEQGTRRSLRLQKSRSGN